MGRRFNRKRTDHSESPNPYRVTRGHVKSREYDGASEDDSPPSPVDDTSTQECKEVAW